MFNGLNAVAIDQSGGLYFGGSSPAGYAFGVTNAPDYFAPITTGRDPYETPPIINNDNSSWAVIQAQAAAEVARQNMLEAAARVAAFGPVTAAAGGYQLVTGDGPPTTVAQTQAQTMAAAFPSSSLIPGIDNSTLLMIGGGALLLTLLTK